MLNNSKKRILFITPFAPPNIGGAETHIGLLSEYLSKQGCSVTILTYQPLTTDIAASPNERSGSIHIRRFSWVRANLFSVLEKYSPILNFLYITPYLLVRSFFFMLAHHKEIDVIHVFGLNAGMIGRILKLVFRKRAILSIKGIYGFHGRALSVRIMRWVIAGLDVILVGSLDSKEDLINLGIPSGKLTLFTHWIDHARFYPREKKILREQLTWDREIFTVVFVGRLIPPKGMQLLLETARLMPHIHFKIIGDGVSRGVVTESARNLANVHYCGRVEYAALPDYIAAADVLLYPVLYHDDVSLAVLEALSCGVPVVTTNHGSGIYRLPETVALITTVRADDIQGKIQWLMDHPEEYAQMAKNAQEFATQFSEQLVETIAQTYNYK